MKHAPKKTTSEGLFERFFPDDPEARAQLEEERERFNVAAKLYRLRESSGLSQRELAKRVGTTASAISRLENADYEGHSMAMLRRIAEALGQRVEIRFVKKPGSKVS